jgi:hypothetical protein
MTTSVSKRPLQNRKAKLSLIHLAKKAVGITDEDYRSLLAGAADVGSAAELEYEHQFDAVMRAFKNLGFKNTVREPGEENRPRRPDAWGGTDAQRAKIEAMWRTCARNKTDKALRAFIRRIAHVDHPRFLRPDLSRKVILALGAMMRKAGFDPATGRRITP